MNHCIQKTVIALIASLALGQTFAATKNNLEKETKKEDFHNPYGCQTTGFAFDLKTVILESAKEGKAHAMYLFLNKSDKPITLYQMRKAESSRSMYLNHSIPSGYWGVFATSERTVKYICTTPKQGTTYGEIVDCAQHLKICEFTNVKFGLNNRGNFWLINSSSKNSAVREIVHYGIIPSFSAKQKKGNAS